MGDRNEAGTGAELPRRTRTYQNHHLDSLRWDAVETRPGDVVVAAPYKAGTTWMQAILGTLILPDDENPVRHSPWVDYRVEPIEKVVERLEGQEHRRFLKTHLPLDGLRFDPETRYVVAGRDGRDVFMSLWNHYSGYPWGFYVMVNALEGRVGDPLPRCPDDIRELWEWWIGRGWFEWEREGYPFWSNFRHVQTWWEWRHLENVLFVHYADLLDDTDGEVRRVADHIGLDADDALVEHVVERTSFETMRAEAIAREEEKGGPHVFTREARNRYNKGTNGRWRGVLTDEDLELYEEVVARELSPECARWLESGRRGERSPGTS